MESRTLSQEEEKQAVIPVVNLKGHTDAIRTLDLSPDGNYLASGASDNIIKIWEIKTGKCLQTLQGHTKGIFTLKFLPDGRLASGSWDFTIKLWDWKKGFCLKTLRSFSRYDISFGALALIDENTLAAGTNYPLVQFWNIKTDKYMISLLNDESPAADFRCNVSAILPLSDGRFATGSGDGVIRIWEKTLTTLTAFVNLFVERHPVWSNSLTLKGHTDEIRSLALLSDGILVSSSRDYTIKFWDIEKKVCIRTLKEHRHFVGSLAPLPDGLLASGSDDLSIKIWDTKTGKCLRTLIEAHKDAVNALVLLPDGRLASGSHDDIIKLWPKEFLQRNPRVNLRFFSHPSPPPSPSSKNEGVKSMIDITLSTDPSK
jgi:WD40 repeat protein